MTVHASSAAVHRLQPTTPEVPPEQEIRFCRAPDGVRLGVRDARERAAARRRLVLAQPPAVRLAEPGLAPLPRAARGARDGRPLRRARLRHVRLDGRRLLARGPARRPRDGRRRGRPTSGSRCSGCPAARPSRWPTRPPTRSASRGWSCTAPSAACRSTFTPEGLAEEETYRSDDPGRLGEGGPGLPARLHDELHPRRDRGADALVRRPPADVDVARQRRGQPDRAPAGRPRRRAAADHAPRPSSSRRSATGRRRSTTRSRCPRRSRVRGSSRSRAGTTSCSPTSRRGRCSWPRSRRSSSRTARVRRAPGAGSAGRAALAARARGPPARCRRPDERGDRRRPDAEHPDGRAPPVQRLREARRDRRGRPRGRASRYVRRAHRLTAACRPPSARRLRGPDWVLARFRPGGRSPTVASDARDRGVATEVPAMTATDARRDRGPVPGRPVGRPLHPDRDRHPRQRAGAAVGGRVQLGRRPARDAGRREPRAEPHGVPAGRAGRLRGRVPARHARAAVRGRDRRRDRGRPLLDRPARTAGPRWRRPRPRRPAPGHPRVARRRRRVPSRRCSPPGASAARSTSRCSGRCRSS